VALLVIICLVTAEDTVAFEASAMKLLLKVTFLKHVYNSYSTGISQF
jgi:hypothetical protein